MPEHWRILKFGGTCVDSAASWQRIAGLVRQRHADGDRPLLVCSALVGVTERLLRVEPDSDAARSDKAWFLGRHAELAVALKIEAGDLLSELEHRFDAALARMSAGGGSPARAELVALGEWASTRLGHRFLSSAITCDWLDARELLIARSDADAGTVRHWLSADCDSGRDLSLDARFESGADVIVTQGYVASGAAGGTVLLGRGGSDTSAALLAGRLGARAVEIWTDVPGLYTANPREVPSALLIRRLGYTEALEMAASGARVVHPRCIRAAQDCAVTIQVRDLERAGCEGTDIVADSPVLDATQPGVRAVTRQDGMLVVLLENQDIRRQVGFLAWAFGEIAALGISIDLVATSETTTTLAINTVDNPLDGALRAQMVERLNQRCRVRLYPDSSCINLVGRGVRTAIAGLGSLSGLLDQWPLLMVSQSANDMCLSLLVYPQQAAALQQALHEALIIRGTAARSPGLFGPAFPESPA